MSEIRVRVGPVWVSPVGLTAEQYAWLSTLLTVEDIRPSAYVPSPYSPNARSYTGPRRLTFLSAAKGFPAGLLGYVLDQAQRVGRALCIEWLPEAAMDPVVAPDLEAPYANGVTPYPFQTALVTEALAQGRGIAQSGTGSGKTGMMAMILRALGVPPALVIVSRRSLVRQTRVELGAWLGEDVGEVSATARVLSPRVIVALVNSLAAHAREPWAVELLQSRRVLMLDESHHVSGGSKRKGGKGAQGDRYFQRDSWYRLALACPAPRRYAFSATALKVGEPGQNWRVVAATGKVFQTSVTATQLIDHGKAARPYIYYQAFNVAPLAKRRPYAEVVAAGIDHCGPRNEAALAGIQVLYGHSLKVLVLVQHIEHGEVLYHAVRGAGMACMFLSGRQDQHAQEEGIQWLKGPGARVMVSTSVLGEGTNVPALGGVVYALGGKSYVNLFQYIGRAMRAKGPDDPGVCFVLDFADDHHRYLAQHYAERRVLVARESGFLVAAPGQTFAAFVQAVLSGQTPALGAAGEVLADGV